MKEVIKTPILSMKLRRKVLYLATTTSQSILRTGRGTTGYLLTFVLITTES